ncbi:hypothetical protein WJX79_004405 [Trebouxia sp. C0005]
MIPVSSMPCHHHSLRLAVGYALPLIALDPSATILAYLQILWSTAAVDTFQGRQKFMIKWLQQDLLYQDNPLCKQTPHGTIRLYTSHILPDVLMSLMHNGTGNDDDFAGLLAILLWVDTGNTAKQLDAFNKKNKTNFCMV